MKTLVATWLATAMADFAFSSVLATFIYKSGFGRLWKGVASVPLGAQALEGGTSMVLAGIGLHFMTAFAWSAVFVFGVTRLSVARKALTSNAGAAAVAAIYGPIVWMTMSFFVIPLFTGKLGTLPAQTLRWWIQCAGHMVFVAGPMVLVARNEKAAPA